MEAVCSVPLGNKVYDPEIIICAFEDFDTSRSLYNHLKLDYQLPSIQTLTRVTSKLSQLGELNFLQRMFNSIEENQKDCTILFDEVYVKQMMLYHGGIIYGKACNNPSLLANTVLGILVDCMYGANFLAMNASRFKIQDSRLFNSTKERIYYKENLRKYMEIKYY